jgi:hypothetical protein
VASRSDEKLLDKFALDPTEPETRRIVHDVLASVAELFPDEVLHVGGDEVDVQCWSSLPDLMARAAGDEAGGEAGGEAFSGDAMACAGWRQTSGCVPDGEREPEKDGACDFSPPRRSSGFCECRDSASVVKESASAGEPARRTLGGEADARPATRRAEVGCEHATGWTCADACAASSATSNEASNAAVDAGVMRGGAHRGRANSGGSAANANVAAPSDESRVVAMFSQFVRWAVGEVDALGRRSAVWAGAIDGGDPAIPLPSSTIVEPWKCWGGGAATTIAAALAANRSIVNPTCMYLDWMDPWETYYAHSPAEGVSEDASPEQVGALLLGGEGCLWSENIDATNLMCRAWPRASAVAERLWSSLENAPRSAEGVAAAAPRLEQHWRRMVSRGIDAAPFTTRDRDRAASSQGNDRGYTGTSFSGAAAWHGQCPFVEQSTHRDLLSRRLDQRIDAIVQGTQEFAGQAVSRGSRSALGVAGLTLGTQSKVLDVMAWLVPQELDFVAICDADGWNVPGKDRGTTHFATQAGFAFSYLHAVGGDNRCVA